MSCQNVMIYCVLLCTTPTMTIMIGPALVITDDLQKNNSPWAEFKVFSREAVVPGYSLIFSFKAEHSGLVLLRGDVLLPLPLAVTGPAAEVAVKADLKVQSGLGRFSCCGCQRSCFNWRSKVNLPSVQQSRLAWRYIFLLGWTGRLWLHLLGDCGSTWSARCCRPAGCPALQTEHEVNTQCVYICVCVLLFTMHRIREKKPFSRSV